MLFHPSYSQLINIFNQYINWSDEEKVTLTSQLTCNEYPKGTFLLQPGEICNFLWFFNKGLCRIVYKADREKTIYFAKENNFICDLGGLLFDLPSKFYFELLEHSEVVVIPKAVINWAQNNMKEGNKLARILHEQQAIAKIERIHDTYSPDVMQRYEKMLVEFPLIEQRVSQKIIASYLNISSVHLSRLKAKQKKHRN